MPAATAWPLMDLSIEQVSFDLFVTSPFPVRLCIGSNDNWRICTSVTVLGRECFSNSSQICPRPCSHRLCGHARRLVISQTHTSPDAVRAAYSSSVMRARNVVLCACRPFAVAPEGAVKRPYASRLHVMPTRASEAWCGAALPGLLCFAAPCTCRKSASVAVPVSFACSQCTWA